jgi:hypothetical protein
MVIEAGALALIFGFGLPKKTKEKDSEFEVEKGEYTAEIRHIDEVEKLKRLKEPPETILEILDVISRDFFKKKFHIKKSTEYSDLIEFFTEKNAPQIINFCRRMNEALYSGRTLTAGNINDLIADLEAIISKEDKKSNGYETKRDLKFYSLVDKLSLFDSKKEKAAKEEYLGKKTKEIITSKLIKRKESIQPQKMEIPIGEDNYDNPEAQNTALSLINTEEDVENNPEIEPEEDKLIESIDDLDRIKEKIQQRKKNPAEKSQESYN